MNPEYYEYILFALIAVTGYVTHKGLSDPAFQYKYLFQIAPIRYNKDYKRLFTSGFLHGDWMHFGLNMYVLYSFGLFVLYSLGLTDFLLLYFVSMLGGSLYAYALKSHNDNYAAVGASGAVNGIIFAAIMLNPFSELRLFFAIPIPAWIFGIAYTIYSVYGMKGSFNDNIGHEAHMGGGIVGVLLTCALIPGLLLERWWLVLAILVPLLGFTYYLKQK